MIVAPYRDFPFLVPQTFHEFFTTVHRALIETNLIPSHHDVGRSDPPFARDNYRSRRYPNYSVPPAHTMVSISLPLEQVGNPLSPLNALEMLSVPADQHFYWEKQDIGDAIAAVGCVVEQNLSGGDRFSEAQRVLDQWFNQIAIIGNLNLPFSGPHVFCRFTFFDHTQLTHDHLKIATVDPSPINGHPPSSPFPPASIFLPCWHIGQHHHQRIFVANIAVSTRPDHHGVESPHHAASSLDLKQQCLDRWHVYQHLGRAQTRMNRASSNGHTAPCTCSSNQHPSRSHEQSDSPASAPIRPRSGSNSCTPNCDAASRSDIGPSAPTIDSETATLPWSSPESFQLPLWQKEDFKQSVHAALETIETSQLSKVVLAQALDVTVETPFQVFPSLHNLRQIHGDCHVFSTANGQGQVFLGASPERLLSIRDRTLYTEAIAGSAPRGQTSDDDEHYGNTLLCSLKELHEHQLVVNYITQQLAQLNLEPQRSPFPKLLQLPNIQHLHTPICATLPSDLQALDIVAQLHPTPAVAGVPQAMACDFIQSAESFERSLYAAPIGWVNYQGDSEFIVGIRSALLDNHRSRLYAGAGIVRGSQPELEVSEIELKFQALLTTLLF